MAPKSLFAGCILLVLLASVRAHVDDHVCIHNELQKQLAGSETVRVPQDYAGAHTHETDHDTPTPSSGRRLLSHHSGTLSGIRITLDTRYLDSDTSNRTCQTVGDTVLLGVSPNASLPCDAAAGITTDCFLTCTADDLLTPAKKTRLLALLNSSIETFNTLLQVKPVQGSLKLTNSQNCGFDGGLSVPTSYTASGPGVSNSDLLLFVSARPTVGATVAFAGSCQADQYFRPIAGQVNWSPAKLTDFANNPRLEHALKRVAMHEITHVLGFAVKQFSQFLDVRASSPGHNTTLPEELVLGNHTVKPGHTQQTIVTPTVVEVAKRHFGCPSLDGVLLEAQGGSGSAGSHWEKRILGNELMTGSTSNFQDNVLSNLTLALFHDMGFYRVDFAQAESLVWGSQLGCNFTSDDCVTGSGWPTQGYRCEANVQSCTFDRQHKGVCQVTTYGQDLPAEYQHFAGQPRLGGTDVLADYCPYVNAFSNRDCVYGGSFGTPAALQEQSGYSARCFMSTLEHSLTLGDDPSQFVSSKAPIPICFNYRCLNNTWLQVEAKDVWFDCAADSNGTVFGFTGALQCPTHGEWMCSDFEARKSVNATLWPTLASVSPSSAPFIGGTRITLTGTNLQPASGMAVSVDINGFQVPPGSIQSVTATSIVLDTPVVGGLQTDTDVDVVVTIDRTSGNRGYAGSARMYAVKTKAMTITTRVPEIDSVQPQGGPATGGTRITISGRYLGLSGFTRVQIGSDECTNVVLVGTDFTRLTCLSPAQPSITTQTNQDVKILFNSQLQSVSSVNAYAVGPSWPTVKSVYPGRVSSIAGMSVLVRGTQFHTSMSGVSLGNMNCQPLTIVSSSVAWCVTQGLASFTGTESVDVNVQSSDKRWAQGIYAAAIDAAYPRITSVSPSRVPDYGGTVLTIQGTSLLQLNQTSNANVTYNAPRVLLGVPEAGDSSSVACTITQLQDGQMLCTTGLYGGVGGGGFESVHLNVTGSRVELMRGDAVVIDAGWPSVSGIDPAGASTLGTSYVVITGSRFPVTGTVPTVRIGGVLCTAVRVISSTQLTCKAGVVPASQSNVVTAADVVVTDAQGRGASLTQQFSYDPAWPRFSTISPSAGNSTGGYPVTITGNDFVPGVPINVTMGNSLCSNANVTSTTTVVCTAGSYSLGSAARAGVQIVIMHGRFRVLSDQEAFFYQAPPTTPVPPPWPWYFWAILVLILLVPYMVWGALRAGSKPVPISDLVSYRVHVSLVSSTKKKKKRGGILSF